MFLNKQNRLGVFLHVLSQQRVRILEYLFNAKAWIGRTVAVETRSNRVRLVYVNQCRKDMMEPLTFVVVAIWIVMASGGLPPVIRIGKF